MSKGTATKKPVDKKSGWGGKRANAGAKSILGEKARYTVDISTDLEKRILKFSDEISPFMRDAAEKRVNQLEGIKKKKAKAA